jgi:hypothetical protein
MVETVQGYSYGLNKTSRTAPPVAAARQVKSCCSPWLLALLGLLALGGLLVAIFASKSGSTSTAVEASTTASTSIPPTASSNSSTNSTTNTSYIKTVAPISNITSVRGTTVVTDPTSYNTPQTVVNSVPVTYNNTPSTILPSDGKTSGPLQITTQPATP